MNYKIFAEFFSLINPFFDLLKLFNNNNQRGAKAL